MIRPNANPRPIHYRGYTFYIHLQADGWYNEDVFPDEWVGPFEDASDAISDGAERLDLAIVEAA